MLSASSAACCVIADHVININNSRAKSYFFRSQMHFSVIHLQGSPIPLSATSRAEPQDAPFPSERRWVNGGTGPCSSPTNRPGVSQLPKSFSDLRRDAGIWIAKILDEGFNCAEIPDLTERTGGFFPYPTVPIVLEERAERFDRPRLFDAPERFRRLGSSSLLLSLEWNTQDRPERQGALIPLIEHLLEE